MRKLYSLLIALVFFVNLFAQSPQKMSYQAIIRNSSDQLVANHAIGMRVSILQGSSSGTAVYIETQTTTSNVNGLVSIEIGGGTVVYGTFAGIDWSLGTYFIKTDTDPTGGTNYTITGTSQILSVPYALYAKTAGNSFSGAGNETGDMLFWDGTKWGKISVGKQGQFLQLQDFNIPRWSGDYYPILTTAAVTSITSTSAISGGNITDVGTGEDVLGRGVLWSTSPHPAEDGQDVQGTTDGDGQGSFISSITGLSGNTTYYLRAYAYNDIGQGYGNEISFTTPPPTVPVLTTTTTYSITNSTAESGGNVVNDGGATLTEKGICWSTSTNPTILNNKIIEGSTEIGNFYCSITGLTATTVYYVRAYATNSVGTSYGNQVSFTTYPYAPVVVTTGASLIKATSATIYGNVTSDEGATVSSRGICWSTLMNPTTANNKTNDGTGTGIFGGSISGFTPSTLYYARAYATNSVGTSYGNQVSFTTQSGLIALSTANITSITSTSASTGGNITNDGGADVLSRGVCWGTSINPTILNSKTIDGNGIGPFTSSMTGLSGSTTYYVRAYATNSVGTSYGNQVSFTTSPAILPILTTTSATLTTLFTTAASGGNITSDGGASVIARGVCWGTTTNPTIALSTKTTNGTGIGSFTSSITGLTTNTIYYIRAYATNSAGTSYGNQVILKTGIGGSFQGGVIAYILQPGDAGYFAGQTHGIIAAPNDQAAYIQWYNGSNTITGAIGTALGTGNSNTNLIVANQGLGSYAARICYDLNLGGYTDWYLPSKDELNKLYLNRTDIGGFTVNYYWSSTENSSTHAYIQYFNVTGVSAVTIKSTQFSVRAIRSF